MHIFDYSYICQIVNVCGVWFVIGAFGTIFTPYFD